MLCLLLQLLSQLGQRRAVILEYGDDARDLGVTLEAAVRVCAALLVVAARWRCVERRLL